MHVHLDFETRSTVDLKKVGLDAYAKHSTTEPLCLAYAFGNGPVLLWKLGDESPTDLLEDISNEIKFVAHNASFEIEIWNHICVPRFGWPILSVKDATCTQAMAYAMGLPGSLEGAAAAVGITHQKDMQGSRIMLQLCKPRSTDDGVVWWDNDEKYAALYKYCMNDVVVERELHERLMTLSSLEKEIWHLDYKINRRGVQCDIDAVKSAIKVVDFEKKRLDLEMQRITSNAVGSTSAVAQLTEWLVICGVKIDGIAKSDVVDLLKLETLPALCRQALLIRQEAAKSSNAKLKKMIESASTDGRIRGIFQYHGASTGRWAGRRIQPQNFPRPRLKEFEIENVFKILGSVDGCS